MAQCESLMYKFYGGVAARGACYGVIRGHPVHPEEGAKGCASKKFYINEAVRKVMVLRVPSASKWI